MVLWQFHWHLSRQAQQEQAPPANNRLASNAAEAHFMVA
jgi:hypothetical protein